ncbi:DnaB-like helicase N-terminal domain-containing protein [Clostridioides difficile]|uniref:DnaB-like helicase N-terminal domain-containing protein n=1 Tax=Clostridioides difficile TaxID=1496 RepID=UPI00131BB0B3|nr:DnaB-like helicase N-terminal domain-containing protein [Clostridioides difficile]
MLELNNLQAEQSILGAIMLDNTVVYVCKECNLLEEDFLYNSNKIIYKTMIKLSNEDKAIDIITLTDELNSVNQLKDVGGLSYITSLTTIVPTVSNAKYYIEIVKELSKKRVISEKLSEAINQVTTSSTTEIVSLLDEVKEIALDAKKIDDLYIDASLVKRNKSSKMCIKTGFRVLDEKMNGLTYGSMTIITGDPSSGKSTIINQIVANAISDGYKTFIYSGELPSYQLKEWFVRTVCNDYHLETMINSLGEKYKDATEYSWELISEWIKKKFYIYGEDSKANEKNLIQTIEHLYTRKDVRLFILDNLMTIDSSGKDKYEKQENLAKELKRVAKKYGLVIILVAHPNKSSHMNNEPSMFDVSGASEVVNLADYVLKTIRTVEDGKDESSILILKNRITGKQRITIRTYFNSERKRFYTNDNTELKKDFGYDHNKKFVQAVIEDDIFGGKKNE